MKLENQVTNLELSRKLKELGVKQESLWYWSWYGQNTFPPDKKYGITRGWTRESEYSAFTVAELGEMLEDYMISYKIPAQDSRIKYCCERNKNTAGGFCEYADTEANARAKMLIYLIENGLIKSKALTGE